MYPLVIDFTIRIISFLVWILLATIGGCGAKNHTKPISIPFIFLLWRAIILEIEKIRREKFAPKNSIVTGNWWLSKRHVFKCNENHNTHPEPVSTIVWIENPIQEIVPTFIHRTSFSTVPEP